MSVPLDAQEVVSESRRRVFHLGTGYVRDYTNATTEIVVCVLWCANSSNSSMYLWTSSRLAGHTFIFDCIDSVHLFRRLKGAVPSFALQQRSNTLLNFYCNVYDVAAVDQRRCCIEHHYWQHRHIIIGLWRVFLCIHTCNVVWLDFISVTRCNAN